MRPASEAAPDLRRGNLTYLPVVAGRLEFASAIRRRLLEQRPAAVAVELPVFLEEAYLEAAARLPEMSVILYEDSGAGDAAIYLPVEPCDAFVEAIRTALEMGVPVMFLEAGGAPRPHVASSYPDPYAIRHIGWDRYVEAYRLRPQPRTPAIEAHAAAMAWKLQGADPFAPVAVVVSLNMLNPLLDAMETPQQAPPAPRSLPEPRLLNPHPDCLAEIATEYPYLQERYEQERLLAADGPLTDRPRVQLDLIRDAARAYEINTGESVATWQRLAIARYTRNLASISAELTAGLFDIAVAARGIVDDNFAWEVWETANRYPAQKDKSETLETVNLSGEEVWLNTRKLRLRRREPRPKRMFRPRGLKPRKKEREPGEWARQTGGNAICSYPPEDIAIENYGKFLQRKAKTMLSEERARVEPFLTSIFDGIDLRETIRNWHDGRIWVRKLDRLAGETGALVVIFDEDKEDKYTYLTTWLGEHQNESDMAFYSTQPFEHLVGPGIGRAEYGGFLMTLPPRRLYDVWADPDYDLAESKPERLLLAALDYSVHRFVVYVARKPPRSIFRTLAARMDRRILYLPMGALAPDKIKRLRVVHVLDGYERRAQARDFLW
jgi:hypothetical protein